MSNQAWALISVVVPFLVIFWSVFLRDKLSEKKAEERIKLAAQKVEQEPGKVKPAWDLARATLEAYFIKNLRQINYIFWLSVGVMLVGFGVLVYGILRSVQEPSVVAPAAIATISGIITEFIGATFLFLYRSTIQQAANYTKTLERINSVGMAMQILDTMPDEATTDHLKSATKADLVRLLVKEAQQISSTPQA